MQTFPKAASANQKADAAREEAVVEELAQDLTERYEDLVREGVEEALQRLRGELRVGGALWPPPAIQDTG